MTRVRREIRACLSSRTNVGWHLPVLASKARFPTVFLGFAGTETPIGNELADRLARLGLAVRTVVVDSNRGPFQLEDDPWNLARADADRHHAASATRNVAMPFPSVVGSLVGTLASRCWGGVVLIAPPADAIATWPSSPRTAVVGAGAAPDPSRLVDAMVQRKDLRDAPISDLTEHLQAEKHWVRRRGRLHGDLAVHLADLVRELVGA